MGNRVDFEYDIGEHVSVDSEIKAIVVAALVSGTGKQYKVSYFHNGVLNEPWLDDWRLEKWVS